MTGEGASRERYEVAETVTVDRRYGPLRSLGGPVVLVGSLLGLIVVGLGRRRGVFELTDQEREWLTYRFDWVEFDEWIHAVQLPPEAHDLPRARADSLATLVDFAIDTDCAAVEPPESDGLYVVHDGYLYTYTTPLPPDWTGAESGSDSESASTTLAERPEEADTEAGTGAGTD